jgi:hypothetical protein
MHGKMTMYSIFVLCALQLTNSCWHLSLSRRFLLGQTCALLRLSVKYEACQAYRACVIVGVRFCFSVGLTCSLTGGSSV